MVARHVLPPPSQTDIAVRLLAGQRPHGLITQLAEEYETSRKVIYQIQEQAHQALTQAFAPSAPRPWNADIPDAAVDRTIVSLSVTAPCSTHDIEELLPILYGVRRSHGYIVNTLHTAQVRAHAFLETADYSALDAVALDEMFWHDTPLLTVVDLDLGVLVSAEKVRRCSGPEWVSRLEALKQQNLSPSVTVKDGGLAMKEATEEVWDHAEHYDDLYHTVALLSEAGRFLENQAYRAMASYEEAMRPRRTRKGTMPPSPVEIEAAQQRMDEAIDRFDTFDGLRRQVERVLSLCDRGCGRLRTAAEVQQRLPSLGMQIIALGGDRLTKAGRYLKNRAVGLSLYLERLGGMLGSSAQRLGDPALVEAAVRVYQANLQAGRGPRWDRAARQEELRTATQALVEISGPPCRLVRVIEEVFPLLNRRHRASSAIENVHSVLRPYIVVHKGVQQGFLDLFRFYWNLRECRWGRHKGSSAWERLTGQKVDDWLSVLGFPPI